MPIGTKGPLLSWINKMLGRGSEFCRSCNANLSLSVLSLGDQPLSNALPRIDSQGIDPVFPLDFKVCQKCGLGQIGEFVSPEDIFSEYTYFSSTSRTWLDHAKNFSNACKENLELSAKDLVLEIASNDGYLLQYFQELDIEVLGIEPAANVAAFANSKGVPTICEFFGRDLAEKLISKGVIPKLIIANNVLAHVPNLNDFMEGLKLFANRGSVISIEAPSMLVMLQNNLFDTIYHEHFSYLSVTSILNLTKSHNLSLFNVEFLLTHGGSYRYWIGESSTAASNSVSEFLDVEKDFGILENQVLENFRRNSEEAINLFASWVNAQANPLIGYGAPAKATVLLNAANISSDKFLAICDNAAAKQNRFIPGCRIPIFSPEQVVPLAKGNLVIFPWNISKEILEELQSFYPDYAEEIWVPLPTLVRVK